MVAVQGQLQTEAPPAKASAAAAGDSERDQRGSAPLCRCLIWCGHRIINDCYAHTDGFCAPSTPKRFHHIVVPRARQRDFTTLSAQQQLIPVDGFCAAGFTTSRISTSASTSCSGRTSCGLAATASLGFQVSQHKHMLCVPNGTRMRLLHILNAVWRAALLLCRV